MMQRMLRPATLLLFGCCCLATPRLLAAAADAPPSAEQVEFFEKKIRPVLVEHCYKCHSATAEKIGGRLLLDTRVGIRRGGESGHAVMPGDIGGSLLIEAIRYEGLEMPPDRKLPAQVVADFETWIKMGALDPRDGQSTHPSLSGSGNSASVAVSEGGPVRKSQIVWDKARQHWSFQPPQRHEPAINNNAWVKQPIDAFILSRLEEAGLQPNSPADRRTWIRRVSFDLIGLPPTPEQVEAFVNDPSPIAYDDVVESLLSSSHYGERWARLWLDVARYAEDQAHVVGNNDALFYPNAYLYRDWVIGALNDDLPYDQFIKLQLAADAIGPGNAANYAALGFIGLGPKYYRRNDLSVMADEWEDRVDTVSRGLLGLTVACARCHDHKFDPIATEDYYALAGIFASTEMFNRPLDDKREKDNNGQAKAPKDSLHVVRDTKPTDLNVFIRGDVNNKGPQVPRRFLQVLCDSQPSPFAKGSGRLELAEAIASRDNPLTARVLVNRVWGELFGRPLVATPSNFGSLGERPTHPELLDDLAVRFMESGWSIKWLQRQIVLSATYRQSSEATADKLAADPDNRLLGRMNRKRLSVEAWRDAILAVSGRLDGQIGGRSIDPQHPDSQRRTIYSRISRLELNRMLALFDFPDPNAHADRRSQTTTPLQKLFVLNSPFMIRQTESLTARLLAMDNAESNENKTSSDVQSNGQSIERVYLLLYGRPATDDERRLGLEFLGPNDQQQTARWQQYAQVLLASNEMMFLD
jgi:cytochrome c553